MREGLKSTSRENSTRSLGPTKYKGLCARFKRISPYLVPSVAILTPQLSYYASQQFANVPASNQNLFIATTIGIAGLFAGGGAHVLCNKFLHHTGVKRKQGSSITQKIQIATYAAVVAAGMCFADTQPNTNSSIEKQTLTNTSQDLEINHSP